MDHSTLFTNYQFVQTYLDFESNHFTIKVSYILYKVLLKTALKIHQVSKPLQSEAHFAPKQKMGQQPLTQEKWEKNPGATINRNRK